MQTYSYMKKKLNMKGEFFFSNIRSLAWTSSAAAETEIKANSDSRISNVNVAIAERESAITSNTTTNRVLRRNEKFRSEFEDGLANSL